MSICLIPRGAVIAILMLTSASAQSGFQNDAADLPQITVTRFRSLNIPFDLHATTEHTREVQLLVSTDGGGTWNVEQVVGPGEGTFSFAARQDGEHWFAVRTIDPLGNMIPEGTPQPEARILIDSTAPRLELQAAIDTEGKLIAQWQSPDPALQEGSLRLEYRASGDSEWLPFPVSPGDDPQNSTGQGKVSWLFPVVGDWELRTSIADTAGNQTTVIKSIQELASKNGRPEVVTDESLHSAIFPQNQRVLPGLPPRGPSLAPHSFVPNFPNTATDDVQQLDESRNQNWKPSNMARSQVNGPANTSHGEIADDARTAHESSLRTDENLSGQMPLRNVGLVRDLPDSLSDQQSSAPSHPLLAELVTANPFSPQEPVLYVNSLEFVLEFDTPRSSIALDAVNADYDVELWGTVNSGQTWRRFAVAKSSERTLTAQVETSGVYGFRLVDIDRTAVQMPPRSGETPEVWVVVDLASPICQLINATQGDDQHSDELTVSWNASDEHLASAAITLQFAPTPQGPWQTFVRGAENSGKYLWRMDRGVPGKFYLRLLAQDMAGNHGEYVSRVPVEPILRDLGRMIGVRAAEPGKSSTGSPGFHSAKQDR
ncbi:MAG: hypothetical protein MPJ50_00060 [Pirellulales bacterium]|nr:hypothetical protein [Pirellulales bacterium]